MLGPHEPQLPLVSRTPRYEGNLNRSISSLRAAIERAIAHLKDWKILATRYRGPLAKFPLVAKTVTALTFYKKGW
ncbi:hypothetical protein ABIE67_010178 [Streptomyces sp. V4I8]|uniref:hypothetical protein n=1 Tax=Streptomyces sp. V4I8 TaxID=3156469 RepID=UPI0035134349